MGTTGLEFFFWTEALKVRGLAGHLGLADHFHRRWPPAPEMMA